MAALIYSHPGGGALYQAGDREIRDLLDTWPIDLVVFCAVECPAVSLSAVRNGRTVPIATTAVALDDRAIYTVQEVKDTASLVTGLSGALAHAVARDRRHVLAACAMGLNRSGLVVGMTLRRILGCTDAEAIERIRAVRGPDACRNQMFNKILRRDWRASL